MRCLRLLCKICGRQALIPRPLAVMASYDRTGAPLGHGGFADVWMGRLHGRDVAIKVLKMYQCSDHEQIRRVSFPWCSVSIVSFGELTVMCVEVLQGSRDVEGTSTSKRFTADRSHDDRQSIRDGDRMDGKR